MTEIQTVLRDVLTLQLNSGSALMNEHARDALAEFAARTSARRPWNMCRRLRLCSAGCVLMRMHACSLRGLWAGLCTS